MFGGVARQLLQIMGPPRPRRAAQSRPLDPRGALARAASRCSGEQGRRDVGRLSPAGAQTSECLRDRGDVGRDLGRWTARREQRTRGRECCSTRTNGELLECPESAARNDAHAVFLLLHSHAVAARRRLLAPLRLADLGVFPALHSFSERERGVLRSGSGNVGMVRRP